MQPVAGMGEKELTEDEEHLLKDEKYHIITQSYTEILKQSSDLECEYTYNLTNVFDSYNERIYVTRAHLTDNGNKILADEIFNLIHTYVEK